MPTNPHASENYADLLGELEYAKCTLAQARIRVCVAALAAQRAIEAIDHVEAAWGWFGRRRLPASRHALQRLLEGAVVDAEPCIEAVKELSALLLEHEPEGTQYGRCSRQRCACASSGRATLEGRIST